MIVKFSIKTYFTTKVTKRTKDSNKWILKSRSKIRFIFLGEICALVPHFNERQNEMWDYAVFLKSHGGSNGRFRGFRLGVFSFRFTLAGQSTRFNGSQGQEMVKK
jgi:hypothetical protein